MRIRPTNPGPSARARRRAARSRGFTLIEMIGVFAVLMILAAIIFGIVPGALRQASVDQAEAEIQVIQQGLEAYRARFGAYPRPPTSQGPNPGDELPPSDAAASAYLASALNGLVDPARQPIDGQSLINNSVLTYESAGIPRKSGESIVESRILDPWGSPYVYHSAKPGSGGNQAFGYELYSLGPDKTAGTPDDIRAR